MLITFGWMIMKNFHLFYSRYSLLTSKTRQNILFMTGLQNNSNNSDEMLETVFFWVVRDTNINSIIVIV